MQYRKEDIAPLISDAKAILKASRDKHITAEGMKTLFDLMLKLVKRMDRVLAGK